MMRESSLHLASALTADIDAVMKMMKEDERNFLCLKTAREVEMLLLVAAFEN